MKCECEAIHYVNGEYGDCENQGRFKIIDFECGNESGDYETFWVCKFCINWFICENEDNSHYILLEDKQ